MWRRLSWFSHFLHSIGQRVPELRDQEKGQGRLVGKRSGVLSDRKIRRRRGKERNVFKVKFKACGQK